MAIRQTLRHAITNHRLLGRRLKRRLILFPIIALVMFGVVIYDAVVSDVSALWILAGGLPGAGIGYLIGRLRTLSWHEDSGTVVMGIDRLSVLLIIAYVLFRIASREVLGEFVHGQELTVVTYSLLGGVLLGRMIGILHQAGRVLERRKPKRRHH